ncbi:MAG: glycosyltransferase [Desulfobulbaceae bacterium]|nr:glycosyltransferase [Desulfobulbaceae bacterium]
MNKNNLTLLQQANEAFRQKNYDLAAQYYENLIYKHPELESIARFNLNLSLNKCAKRNIPEKNESKFVDKHLNILFVLYGFFDSNSGLHAQLHARRLRTQGVSCAFVVPDNTLSQTDAPADTSVFSYTSALSPDFSFPFDIIHAWTPRENVRKVCETLLTRHNCPLIIHLEDNEEYLTEVTIRKQFSELNQWPDADLNKLIPSDSARYHPRKGRSFLDKADGLTLIIKTLNRFNTRNVPIMVLPAPVDERLFYPRPLNTDLRKELDIPEGNVVLAYTGNVHDGNKDEVLELYKALTRLNDEGCPATLLRTGLDKKGLGIEKWDVQHVKHLGLVERTQIPEILAAADILVQPGLPGPFNDERVPSKLPEYFAMGRFVVLPRTNLGLTDVHDGNGIVVDKADADGIFKAVKSIVSQNTASKERVKEGNIPHQGESDLTIISRLKQFYFHTILKKIREDNEMLLRQFCMVQEKLKHCLLIIDSSKN